MGTLLSMRQLWNTIAPRIAYIVASMAGIGRVGAMPGTVASIVAVPILLVFHAILPGHLLGRIGAMAIAFVLLWLLSLWAVDRSTSGPNRDQRWVVIDEFLGMYIALLPMAFKLAHPFFAIVGLVLFRLFDIRKPLGIRKLEGPGTPFSVLSDDIAAGFAAALLFWLFLSLDTLPSVPEFLR